MFDKSKLDIVFSKLKKPGRQNSEHHYIVIDNIGNQTGQIMFIGNELSIEVDNFPGQKKYFSTTLPIGTYSEFASELERAGLEIF
jgi:hypothetical protein